MNRQYSKRYQNNKHDNKKFMIIDISIGWSLLILFPANTPVSACILNYSLTNILPT